MAPRRDVPQDGANERRNAQTSTPPFGGGTPRGSAADPYHVRITGASDEFYAAFRSPGGAARRQERAPQPPHGPDDPRGPGAGYESILADSRAIQTASRQAARSMQLAADAAQQFARTMTAEGERQRQEDQGERVQLSRVLERMEEMLSREREEGGSRGGRRRRRSEFDDDEVVDLDDLDGTGRPPDTPGGDDDRRERRRRRRDPEPDPPQPPAPRVPTPFDERVAELHQRGMRMHGVTAHSLRTQARHAFAEALHNRYGEGTGSPTLVAQHDEDGNLTHYNLHHPDGTVERVESNSRRIPGLLAMATRQGAVTRTASMLSAGGFGAAARGIPYVGQAMAALNLVNEGAEWITEQRAQNAKYQAIYGDSNLDAMGARMMEQGFVLSQRFTGGMTEEMARRAFQGVSSLGYSGEDRTERLDFISDAYKSMGMSVEQSLKAVSLAARSANTNFAGLQRGLKDVTQAAAATGQSAQVMRDQMLDVYATVSQAGFGTGSSSLAAGAVAATTGINRQFDQINLSGLGNNTALRIAAAQTGQTYGQLLAGEQQGKTTLAHTIDQQQGQAYNSAVGPQAQQAAQQGIAAAGGGEAVARSQGDQHKIALQVMQQPDWDSQVVAANLYALTAGQVDVRNADPTVVAEQYVTYMSGVRLEDQQKKAQGAHEPRSLKASDYASKWDNFWQGHGDGTTISQFVSDETPTGLMADFDSGNRAKKAALGAYSDRQNTVGQTDPVLEDLIHNYGAKTDVGYEVQTKDGKKVVSLDEAIKYYPDQLAHGTATIVGGDDDGKSVSDAVGYTEQSFTPNQGQSADTTSSDNQGGVSADDWRKDHPTDQSDAQDARGKITIEASDELRRMFNFTGSGVVNSQVESGASSGVPPAVSAGPN